MTDTKYDIAISFAGEDRKFVRELVGELVMLDMNVFYDEFEEAELWGKDLYEHLSKVYSKEASFCIMVISEDYIRKNWTRHERRAAQSRAFEDNKEYILPIRLGEVDVPGVLSTTGYIDATKKTISEIANLAKSKVKNRYIEKLGTTPELTFKYDPSNCILVPVKSNNDKLNNRIAFIVYSLNITNVCARKLTLVNFEIRAEIGYKVEIVSHETPRLSMIEHRDKKYFPNKGELLLVSHLHGNIILQNWKSSKSVVSDSINPGEILNLSLLFVFKETKIEVNYIKSLVLVITDSWGVKHEHGLMVNDSMVKEDTWYADAYFVYNGGKESKVYFNLDEYPVQTY